MAGGIAATLGCPALPHDLGRVEAALKASVASDDPFLTDIATHLIAAGGKRVRPTLAIAAAYAGRGGHDPVDEDVITGAVAVELVHLGSLYHDDVIDEASTRRGVPSVNSRWSNIVAILAGDFLLARASELAASLGTEVAALLARTIGELCKGEVLELQHTFNIDRDRALYDASIAGKTASLMATSCRVGALAAQLDRAAIDALTSYGFHSGMAFQIVDDVLDVTGTSEELGKPAGNDLVEGVYNLPVIEAVHRVPELREILGGPIDAVGVAAARSLITESGAIEWCVEQAQTHLGHATAALRSVPSLNTSVVDGLDGLAQMLVTRSV